MRFIRGGQIPKSGITVKDMRKRTLPGDSSSKSVNLIFKKFWTLSPYYSLTKNSIFFWPIRFLMVFREKRSTWFFEKILKKLIIFQVVDFHNLNEIIKFGRKSWFLYFIRHCDWSNFLQMWDTVFRIDLKFVISEPSVNFHTCKISKSKSS